MSYFEEEENEIKYVISHKKNEFRVEIRRRKMQQDFQTKRLKIIHNQLPSIFMNNKSESDQNGYNQTEDKQMNNKIQNISTIELHSESDQTFLNENNTPDILDFEECLSRVMMQLYEGLNKKDILRCQNLMRILHKWLFDYAQNKEISEVKQALNAMIAQNMHLLCTALISIENLQFNKLLLSSYYILAQMSSIINRNQFNEMVDKHFFKHLIDSISYIDSPNIIDNLFHTMGNLAGDSQFGSYFCSELVDRDIIPGVVQVLKQCQEDQIEQFIDAYLFFLHHFIKYLPETKREYVYQFLHVLFLLLKSFKKVQIKRYCLECIKLIVTYDITRISEFSDEQFQTLSTTLYEIPQLVFDSLNLINHIIQEYDGDSIIAKLIENNILISLIQILSEANKDLLRERAAFILSNISSANNQYIQNKLLDDKIYKPIMKSLVDDIYSVRSNLAYFLVNLISSATGDTLIILIENKSVIYFLSMIFQQFNQEIKFIIQALSSFWQLFQTLSIFTEYKTFIRYFKQIQQTGLLDTIESLIQSKNIEISEKAEGIYNKLQSYDLIQQKYQQHSPPRQRNRPISFYNSRNQVAGSQFTNFIQPNLFMKQKINEYQQESNQIQLRNQNCISLPIIQHHSTNHSNNKNNQQMNNTLQNDFFKNLMISE